MLEVKTSSAAGVVRVDMHDTITDQRWFMELWPEGARGLARELRSHAQQAEDGVRAGIRDAGRVANGGDL